MNINVDLIYPIGSIYMTTSTVSPAVLFGGTWERIKGRCIVGVDENDTSFNTVSKTGGSKYLQAHTHYYERKKLYDWDKPGSGSSYGYDGLLSHAGVVVNTTKTFVGGEDVTSKNTTEGNLQPYYTAYIWRRTA